MSLKQLTDISEKQENIASSEEENMHYKIRFRNNCTIYNAGSKIQNLSPDDIVMIQTDHNLEPANILGLGPQYSTPKDSTTKPLYHIVRRASRDEVEKYTLLIEREDEAFAICQSLIKKHNLDMKLIKVERYFNGSKIIFYFTAENRVDFRELVKDLVQEFRTRVEMRQIGVRHETKMIGGLGCCGRELCCSSFIKNFNPVSIKMAKEQDLPLNPSKISGICNRLLCCLTYEYDYYHTVRKDLPKVGKQLKIEGKPWKVTQSNVLEESITVCNLDDPEKVLILKRDMWEPLVKQGKKSKAEKVDRQRDQKERPKKGK